MTQTIMDTTIQRYFDELFREPGYRSRILDLATGDTKTLSLPVDYYDVEAKNEELAEFLLAHPIKSLHLAESMLLEYLPEKSSDQIPIRPYHLPSITFLSVEDVMVEHMGRLVSMEVIVRKTETVRTRCVIAHFMCGRWFQHRDPAATKGEGPP